MDLVDYRPGRVRRDRRRLSRVRRRDRHRGLASRSRSRRSAATMSSQRERRDALVRRPDAARASRDGRRSTRAPTPRKPFRMPVQWVNRPDQRLPRLRRADRGGHGRAGRRGARPAVGPRRRGSSASSTADGDLDEAVAGQSVTLTFADEVDCSRGDVIAAAADPPEVADQFEATIVWMATSTSCCPGRGYLAEARHRRRSPRRSTRPKYEINVNTLEHLAAKTLRAERDRRRRDRDRPRDRVRALCGGGRAPTACSAASS